jgi:hypothetical protein
MTLLMSCRVAGFQHHLGPRFLSQLKAGELLALRREPANRHDPRAIRVEWRGAILGYVPREANFTASQLMDRGTVLRARIGEMRTAGDPRERLTIEVSAESAVEEMAPPASHALDAMVRDPQVPALVLAAEAPATGALYQKALEVLDDAVAAIAWRLAASPLAIRSAIGREVRLWESLSISVDAHGRALKVAILNDRSPAAPRITLDLRRPVSAEGWLDALQPTLSRITREHGLAAALGPMPLAQWMQACLRLTFQDFVDFEALRHRLLSHLAPDPLARSLAGRIFAPSADVSQFNWVCGRVEGLALLAVDAPRMIPYLHLLHADRQSSGVTSAEQMLGRLAVLVPRTGGEERTPHLLRLLSRPPLADDQVAPQSQGQMDLIQRIEAA